MNQEIEKGKAIIQLAQIIAIISGFFFAAGGIVYASSINVLSTALSTINSQSWELIKTSNLDITSEKKELLDSLVEMDKTFLEVEPQIKFIKTSFWYGWVGILVSVAVWFMGYYVIKKARE